MLRGVALDRFEERQSCTQPLFGSLPTELLTIPNLPDTFGFQPTVSQPSPAPPKVVGTSHHLQTD